MRRWRRNKGCGGKWVVTVMVSDGVEDGCGRGHRSCLITVKD